MLADRSSEAYPRTSRSATGGPLYGRHFDFPFDDLIAEYTLVIVYRPAGRKAFAMVTFPGLLAASGELLVAADTSRDGPLYASPDGEHWTRFDWEHEHLNRLVWTGDAFYAVGNGRGIYRADCLGTLLRVNPGHSELRVGHSRQLTAVVSPAVAATATISLTSSDPALAVPSTVTIPATSDRATFPVTALTESENAVITVTARLPAELGAGSASATVSILPAPAQAEEIPALSGLGLLTLVLAIAAAGMLLLRRPFAG